VRSAARTVSQGRKKSARQVGGDELLFMANKWPKIWTRFFRLPHGIGLSGLIAKAVTTAPLIRPPMALLAVRLPMRRLIPITERGELVVPTNRLYESCSSESLNIEGEW